MGKAAEFSVEQASYPGLDSECCDDVGWQVFSTELFFCTTGTECCILNQQ